MKQNPECVQPLARAGIDFWDAMALRRVAMTPHRWHEMECGTESGAIERDEKTDIPYRRLPNGSRYRVPDRERTALKRLRAIMANYPGLGFYVQGDPRGASLYTLRPGDVPEGENPDSYYSRGLAVYK